MNNVLGRRIRSALYLALYLQQRRGGEGRKELRHLLPPSFGTQKQQCSGQMDGATLSAVQFNTVILCMINVAVRSPCHIPDDDDDSGGCSGGQYLPGLARHSRQRWRSEVRRDDDERSLFHCCLHFQIKTTHPTATRHLLKKMKFLRVTRMARSSPPSFGKI